MMSIKDIESTLKAINKSVEANPETIYNKDVTSGEMYDLMEIILESGKAFSTIKNKLGRDDFYTFEPVKNLVKEFDSMIDYKFPIEKTRDSNSTISCKSGIGMLLIDVIVAVRTCKYQEEETGNKEELLKNLSSIAVFYRERNISKEKGEQTPLNIETEAEYKRVKKMYDEYIKDGNRQFARTIKICFNEVEKEHEKEQNTILREEQKTQREDR